MAEQANGDAAKDKSSVSIEVTAVRMKSKTPKKAAATKDEKRKEENQRLHDALIETVSERELSNSESFDKAILAYSSGGLALSLTFLKDAVPFQESICRGALVTSWIGFILAILAVIISFVASQRGSIKQRELARRYYIDDDDCAFNEPNRWAAAVDWLNDIAAFCFVVAVISATTFVYLNLDHKRIDPANEKSKSETVNIKNDETSKPEVMTVPSKVLPQQADRKPSGKNLNKKGQK